MGMLLHRHLVGADEPPVKVEEKLENEFVIEKKDKANDNKRKNSNSKSVSK